MHRTLSLSLVVCLTILCMCGFTLASSVQVYYALEGTTLVTYNINPHTLNFTQVGTLKTSASTAYWLVPSTNDHFLYFAGLDANQNERLWVYATDASGAPQPSPVQVMDATGLDSIQMDPKANFLYAIYGFLNSDGWHTTYNIQRYLVDAGKGTISQPATQATETLPTFDADYCTVSIQGFNSTASKLYDQVYCNTHEGPQATYYERTVNNTTGALGPDVQIYSWSVYLQGGEVVQFVGNHMFDFRTSGDYPPIQSIDIFPAVPNRSKPLVQCTASMIAACGNFPNGGIAHPSGKYVFLLVSNTTTQIERVDLKNHKLVDTSNQIPNLVNQFSPDGTLAYTSNYTGQGYYITVYGFNVTTSQVTPGGQIFVGQQGTVWDEFYPARRF